MPRRRRRRWPRHWQRGQGSPSRKSRYSRSSPGEASRSPTRQELRLGLQYLAEQERLIAEDHRQYVPGEDHALLALAEYCQVILNLDEFLYVE